MKPLRIGGRRVHQIGMPYLYGNFGFTKGDTTGDVIPLVMDPNVSIHEAKTLTCNIRPGRRPRRTGLLIEDRPVPPDERTPEGQPEVLGIETGETDAAPSGS
jgi:hypothetical protein